MSRRVAAVAVGLALGEALVAHALLHALAARTGWVSALLSPGSHSQIAALALGVSFLSSRLAALVVAPAVAGGFLGYLVGYAALGAFRPGRRSP
jgi:hypothetical protein